MSQSHWTGSSVPLIDRLDPNLEVHETEVLRGRLGNLTRHLKKEDSVHTIALTQIVDEDATEIFKKGTGSTRRSEMRTPRGLGRVRCTVVGTGGTGGLESYPL